MKKTKIAGGKRHYLSCEHNPSAQFKNAVTIVTVVYNGQQFIEETILSVLGQTYKNFEYIIIDGASTDKTLEIIKKYERGIDLWLSEPDQGIYNAMNKAIDLAAGEWIIFMNAGDSFFSFETLNNVFGSADYEGKDVLYGDHNVVYPSGKALVVKAGHQNDLWKGSQFCHQSCFVRTLFHKDHYFDESKSIAADFYFFYNAWKNGFNFHYLRESVSNYRAGGISDVKRIDAILSFWSIVDKSFKTSCHFSCWIFVEHFKSIFKRLLR